MQKNYPLFTTGLKRFFQKSVSGSSTRSIVFHRFFAFCFLLLANFGYSQLTTEAFESGLPVTWAVESRTTILPATTPGTPNPPITNNWVHGASSGYQATGGVSVNPALNATVGFKAEYFMITPQFLTPSDGQIRFHTKQGSFTNRGTKYELRISTANQPDLESFNVTLQSWTEATLNVAATTYEEKIVSIGSLPAGIRFIWRL